MQRAKTFFFVSLGILALASTWQLATSVAHGQFGQRAVGFSSEFSVLDDAGNLYNVDVTNASSGPQPCLGIKGVSFVMNMFGGPPPAPVVDMISTNGTEFVLLESGDLYYRCTFTGQPLYAGNVFGTAPVQATETTWGRIKAERR